MKLTNILITTVFALVTLTGCISVETTKSQLASGDPELIETAKQNIYKVALSDNFDMYSIPFRIRCVELTDDQELLDRIFSDAIIHGHGRLGDVKDSALRQMNFKKTENVIKFFEFFVDFYKARKEDGHTPDDVAKKVLVQILAEANEASLIFIWDKVSEKNNRRELWFWLWDFPICKKLVETTKSQKVLVDIVQRLGLFDLAKKHEMLLLISKKLTDQKELLNLCLDFVRSDRIIDKERFDLIFSKLNDDTICSYIRDSESDDERGCNEFASIIWNRITDKRKVVKALTERQSVNLLSRHLSNKMSSSQLGAIIVLAKSKSVRGDAVRKLDDSGVIKQLLTNYGTDEGVSLALAKKLKVGEVDTRLYASTKNVVVKKVLFEALSPEDRAKIRELDKSERTRCEKLIAMAKVKESETFQLGGFYLGMPFQDVEPIISYYFPKWISSEETDSSGCKVLYVPNQSSPFCYADKSGKVYRFNFGKVVLAKFYQFDVQSYADWWFEYRKTIGFDKYVHDTVIREYNNSFGEADPFGPRVHAFYFQDIFRYKNNPKGYLLTFFDDYKITSTGDGTMMSSLINQMLKGAFSKIKEDAGTLRVQLEQ